MKNQGAYTVWSCGCDQLINGIQKEHVCLSSVTCDVERLRWIDIERKKKGRKKPTYVSRLRSV